MHKIVPMANGPNASTLDKYRPIAVLPTFNIIFERILHGQISLYLDTNNLLSEFQYGFRNGCGTEEAAVNVINFICKGLDDGHKGVAGIFYDFSKAFDLVDHMVLLEKLEFYGIHGNELALIKDYFENRKQFVCINGNKSSVKTVKHGVPQGSVLGPLLFKIYLNDIVNLKLFGKMFLYADDICLLYPYDYETVVKAHMEWDAAIISDFSRMNRLFLNANKTQVIRFKPHYDHNNNFAIHVDGREVMEVNSIKYLGVILHSSLSWSEHITMLKVRSSRALGILYKYKNKFSKEVKLLIYQALIHSNFNYMSLLYCSKKSGELESLHRIQKKALKVVDNLPITYPTISLYRDKFPTILPLYGIYKMQLILYVFKCLHGIGHHTLQFTRNQTSFNTRNADNLRVVRCRLECTKQRLEYIGSCEFNNLPTALKNEHRISAFKNLLKKYILDNIDELLK